MSRTRRRRVELGVTLIELLTVVGIIGILAAIAYPSYLQYTRRANRSDALNTLTLAAQALERCYSQTFDYTQCLTLIPANSPNNYYSITPTVNTANYTLTAQPNGPPQDGDTQCQKIAVSSNAGESSADASNNPTTQTCWGSN